MKYPHRNVCVLTLATILVLGTPAPGQIGPDEHAKHHPQPGTANPAAGVNAAGVAPGGGVGGGMGPGMGAGMGEMMKEMGTPPRKELYPSLMSLPDLPLEQRTEVERQAHERMTNGTTLMSEGLSKLSSSAERDDYTAMQDATEQMRQGLVQFESGLAAHRALAEGKAPRNVALQWFKREMNLATSVPAEAPHGLFGLSWFHYVTMFILLAFSTTMIWMSFHRMKRADALLLSLTSGKQTVSAMPATSTQPRVIAPALTPPAATGTPGPAPPPVTAKMVVPTTLPAGRWSGQLRVAQIFQETADVRTFRLMHPAEGDLPFVFEPGQFLTVSVTIDGKEAKRSYSIASSPCCRSWCEVTVKHAPDGLVSGVLHERVKAGDLLGASGPYGKFSFRGTEAPSIVLIAGGVGITPLMSALRYLTDQSWPGEIFLIYACARKEDVIFREELEYLIRRHPNLHVTFVLSKETLAAWTEPRGHISKELLLKAVPNLTSRRVHLCGPPPMMEAVKVMLAEIGVPSDEVKTETFLGAEPRPSPPAGVPISGEPAQAVVAAVCTFTRSGKTAPLTPDTTVLEASEDVGVNIDYSCRQGYCGVCKTKLLSGQVTMAVEDALTPEDKAARIILACQAKSTINVEVEA